MLVQRVLGRFRGYALLRLARHGYLAQTGWLRSVMMQASIDKNGEPVPWITYPALAFLAPRIGPSMSVFEYGCGNSTMWWARRVSRVVSCEHDAGWHARVRAKVPANVDLRLVGVGGEDQYSGEIRNTKGSFDIVVIDGMDRVRCAEYAVERLTSDGVLLFDDSDRAEYAPAYDALRARGFGRIDFWGMKAMHPSESCTSLFYRKENCIGV